MTRKYPDPENADEIEAPEEFVDSYIETALWSSTDDDGDPLDDSYGPEDLDDDTRAKMIEDCNSFYSRGADLWSDNDDRHAGHDFWLTRNGHGAGFWDGDYENGKDLTDLAHEYGSMDLIVGSDGKIHGS